jgi:hypothetical protein
MRPRLAIVQPDRATQIANLVADEINVHPAILQPMAETLLRITAKLGVQPSPERLATVLVNTIRG